MSKRKLPIGIDNFKEVIQGNYYYADKTGMIREFLELSDKVALVTRPRRFGKTLNMTMLKAFFDITEDNSLLFDGLEIMSVGYSELCNTAPVIYITLKDCGGSTAGKMYGSLAQALIEELRKYMRIFKDGGADFSDPFFSTLRDSYETISAPQNVTADSPNLTFALQRLIMAVSTFYGKKVYVFIDEYDAPILASYSNGYHEEVKGFFSDFFGSALKGNDYMASALLTGIQRVAKESIFSQLNHVQTYSVLSKEYEGCFGLTEEETKILLENYDLCLSDGVKAMYDGYRFGDTEIFNPWSVLNYAKTGELAAYWRNTSTNALIHKAVEDNSKKPGSGFLKNFEMLLEKGELNVPIDLGSSVAETDSEAVLWGLFINSGYLRLNDADPLQMNGTVSIPNDEVRTEFITLAEEYTRQSENALSRLFSELTSGNIDAFATTYRDIVYRYTSYYDAKENAYHMLMLGMCVTLGGLYRISSNLEAGNGRSDILLESLFPGRNPHIIIEFKQNNRLSAATLKNKAKEALDQIIDKKYYAHLKGKILLIGIAHSRKDCEMEYMVVER